jgi:uncharacterized membrane protein
MENPSKETLDKWHNDPNNWKWGLFYYNKEDNRLLVDKRNPNLGGTINFAHPKSYLFFIGIVCFFGLVIYMISLKGN